MPSLVPSPKFPTFPTYKISIPLLLFSRIFRREFPQSDYKNRGFFPIIPYLLMFLFAFGADFRVQVVFPALNPAL